MLYQSPYFPFLTIGITDIVFSVFLLFFAIVFIRFYARRNYNHDQNISRFFIYGFYFKIFSTAAFVIIYTLAYGGDTSSYFHNMQVLTHLAFTDPIHYLEILFSGINRESLYFFNYEIGYPNYMWKDPNSFFVSRILSPISIIFGNSFLVCSFVVGIISYWGNWKLFLLFTKKYPFLVKEMAIATLFIPSVLFWGSGIMKDTLIIISMAMLLSAFNALNERKITLKIIFQIIIGVWLSIKIKPYIFVAILPTVFIWFGYEQFQKIKIRLVKVILVPILISAIFFGIFYTFSKLATSLGHYGSFDTMIDRAKIVQEDLLRSEQYGENNFYIGEITGSTSNMIQLFPLALLAGLFRPYIWEAGNIFMLISGIENLLMLFLVITVFFRKKNKYVFTIISKDPFILGLLIFIIFLGYGVGLSTANFGALVRYRIPLMPMLAAIMFIIKHLHKEYLKQFEKKDTLFFTPLGKRK